MVRRDPARGRRPRDRHRHDRRRGAGLELREDRAAAKRWKLDAAMQRHLRRAIFCRSRATRWPRPCVSTPPRPWTCPTGLPAISASCVAPPASAPRSRWRACRCPRPRGRRSQPEPGSDRDRAHGRRRLRGGRTIPPAALAVFLSRRARGAGAGHRDRPGDGGQGGRALLGPRRQGRSASTAPHSAIFEAPGPGYNRRTREHRKEGLGTFHARHHRHRGCHAGRDPVAEFRQAPALVSDDL